MASFDSKQSDSNLSLGPYSDKSGISILDLSKPVVGKLASVNNGVVVEIFEHVQNGKEVADLLSRLSPPHSILHLSKPDSLRLKIANIMRKKKSVKRNNAKGLPAFLSQLFIPPVTPPPPPPPPPPVKRTYDDLEAENEQMKEILKKMEEEHKLDEIELQKAIKASQKMSAEIAQIVRSHGSVLSEHANDMKKLTREKNKLQRLYTVKSNELDTVNLRVKTFREKSNAKSNNIKNLKKQVKRDAEKSEKKLKEIHTLEESNKELQKSITEKDEQLQMVTEQMETAKKERRAALKDLSQVKIRAEKNKCSFVVENEVKINELKSKIKQSDERIKELEYLNELLESDMIQTFEEGKFVNEFRETIMVLLTECNISMSKIPKVINTVCKNLLGKIPDRLPSRGTLHRILNEAKFVAQTQVYESMQEGNDPTQLVGNTLHSDATTKFHRHYQGFQITLRDGSQMTIGLSEVGAGDTQTYMDAFNNTIKNIAAAVCNNTEDSEMKISELVTSLKNTMGDQGPTNPLFNDQLQKLRNELLPKVIDNWDTLSEKTKAEISTMGNFFCKMHLLVNFATEAEKVLKINEGDVVVSGRNPFAFGNESGAGRLVRTAAKAFTQHGSDKAGIASDWETYLGEIGEKNHIITYRGNRFNVLFYDAAATYYHRKHIYDFLSALPDLNNLLKAVNFDIQQRLYLAQIRALGIVDKIITAPLWRVIESCDSILDLNDPLNNMLEKIRAWASDSSPLLEGEALFDDTRIHKDEVYDELFKNTEDPEMETYTQLALEMIISGIVLILERQAKDQLVGGKFFAPSEQQKLSAKNVPTTNNVSERDFGVLDVLVRIKPAATDHAYETYIMWLHNKPSKWLDEMPYEDKMVLLNKARHRYPQIREQYIAKKDTVKKQRVASLKAKIKKQELKEERSRAAKIIATEGVVGLGGVWIQDTLEQELNKLPVQDRKKALHAQITYHKKVLSAKGNAKLFYKSSNNVEYSIEQLKTNLATILEINKINLDSLPTGTLQYNSKESLTSKVEKSKSEMMGKIITQRNNLIAQQQKQLLPAFLENPKDLINKSVKHKCKEEDGTIEWFKGQVTGISKMKDNVQLIEYKIVYDACPEDTWCFPLLIDLKKGDLIIL